jgi:TonB-linked SusC/RagA family outer membrane protein
MNKFSINQKTNPIKYLCILAFTLCTLTSTAQTQQPITGTVTDTQGTLPGVTVLIKGKSTGTLTDENGYFSIAATSTDVLVFSYMGYKTQEITLGNQTVLNIQLEEDTTQLKEVILNAGYYSVKDKERTGSIAQLSSKDIEKQPVSNVLASMQGRMAGVDIIQDSGSPGGAFTIRIRGRNSLRPEGNEPLYIIDGVPYSSETIGGISTSGDNPSLTSPLNSINPSDIESIEVLKDADATAIYGSRGANGVVLITTKKGKAGKTRVTINTSTGVGSVTRLPKLMKTQEYLNMREEAFINDGFTSYPASQHDINGNWDQNRYTDWQKELIGGTAEINLYQASISGGSQHTQYLLSGNYRTETTVFPGDFIYKKGAAHFSMNHSSIDDRFKLTFSSNYTSQNNNLPARDLTFISRRLAPNAPALYDENGNLNWENNTWENPLAPLVSTFNAATNDLTANAVLSYNIMTNLQFKTSFGFTSLQNDERKIQPHTRYNPSFGLGSESSSITNNITNRNSWIIEPQLNWTIQFKKSKIDFLAGSTFQQQITNRLFLSGNGFSSNGLLNNIAAANVKFINLDDEIIYKYQAVFARVNYNLKDRYIINLTGRRDGSSRFGPGNQFATFGSVGAAWLFSNESFLAQSPLLSFGKLRMSYGLTGSDQIGDYQFLDTYSTTGIAYQNTIGLQPSRLFNPEFAWEKNTKFEAAIETGFLNDRINLSIAYYSNRSSNQLVGIPLPATTGFSSLSSNLNATVQNRGLEFTMQSHNFKNKHFQWSTSFNIAANRNKLLSFPGIESSTYANTFVVGEPITITKVYHFLGVNPETGIYEFEDSNGDGSITSTGDRQQVADLSPKFFGGIDNQFQYKNVKLDFLFQFVKQEAFGNYPGAEGTFVNQITGATNSNIQQPLTAGLNSAVTTAYSRYLLSDAAIQDASYIRLKNISLSYDLKVKTAQNLKCLLFIQGQNVLTFTNYKFGDPEFKLSTMYLPPLKVYTAGVRLTF